jgi:hypothetical protein
MQPLRLACRAKDAQQVRDLVTAEIASGVIDPATNRPHGGARLHSFGKGAD